MKRAALYARVSTVHQENEKTIMSQVAEIKARILSDGLLLDENMVFTDDGWSGENLDRPALDALRDVIKLKQIDTLYCYDLGRLSRNFLNQLILKEEIKKSGIELIPLHDIKATNPEEDLMQNVMGLFHAYDKLKILEKFRRGKAYKVKSGRLMGYTPPFGYKLIPKTNKNESYFEIVPEQAEVVKLIFSLVGDKGFTIKRVAEYLSEKGIRPIKSPSGKWSRGRLSTLLANTTYFGQARYFRREAVEPTRPINQSKYKKVKKSSRRKRPSSEHMQVRVPAIVSQELFDKAQNTIKLNTVFCKRNRKNYSYVLSGKIRCSCGRSRTGEGDVSSRNYYYRCTDRLYDKSIRTCYERAVRADIIDKLVWEKVSNLLTSPSLVKDQFDRFTRTNHTSVNDKPAYDSKLDEKLKKLREEGKRYTKAFGQGILTESQFKEQMTSVNSEIRQTKAVIEENKQTHRPAPIPFSMPDLSTFCDKMKTWLSNASPEDKQFIIRHIVETVVASQKEAEISGIIPLEFTQNTRNIGYESIHRHCWPSQCRQINPIQLSSKEAGCLCCQLSFCHN